MTNNKIEDSYLYHIMDNYMQYVSKLIIGSILLPYLRRYDYLEIISCFHIQFMVMWFIWYKIRGTSKLICGYVVHMVHNFIDILLSAITAIFHF